MNCGRLNDGLRTPRPSFVASPVGNFFLEQTVQHKFYRQRCRRNPRTTRKQVKHKFVFRRRVFFFVVGGEKWEVESFFLDKYMNSEETDNKKSSTQLFGKKVETKSYYDGWIIMRPKTCVNINRWTLSWCWKIFIRVCVSLGIWRSVALLHFILASICNKKGVNGTSYLNPPLNIKFFSSNGL